MTKRTPPKRASRGPFEGGGISELDDLSNAFHVVKSRLVNSNGVKYYEFRKTLTPDYWIVWIHLLTGHAVLLMAVFILFHLRSRDYVSQLAAGIPASAILGYTFAYLSLFSHAASHYNLCSNKKLNDLLADGLIGVLFGYPMTRYRPTHFAHHRQLGLPEDPEGGYAEALNFKFIIESLTGVRFLRTIWRHVRSGKASLSTEMPSQTMHWVVITGLVLHGAFVAGALWAGALVLAASWIVAFTIVAPFVSAIRLVLEHRSESADVHTDYRRTPHGAVSRIFGDGAMAQTLGGAGFNRHLLHHWDPQVPYTRLRDLEAYLRDTEMGPIIEARTTSYASIFYKLFQI